ncbi:hepatic lectin-like [Oncorhynchus masou masou]|uniref:hepatic lectin-like n=1 Tax=Oncorhynchus masou masou TaxID=90313 RepID=UPI003183E663
MDNDENTYANSSSFRASPREGAIYFQRWKRPSRAAAVCLGLLCVLLLAGIISLSVYQRNQSTSYNNLTNERDQLAVTEGTWKWVDGRTTPLTTANWGRGQPNGNNGTDQDCGDFVYHPTSQGWWNDEKCSNKQNSICEK